MKSLVQLPISLDALDDVAGGKGITVDPDADRCKAFGLQAGIDSASKYPRALSGARDNMFATVSSAAEHACRVFEAQGIVPDLDALKNWKAPL